MEIYYSVNDIHEFSPEFFFGCENKLINIINKKDIPKKILFGLILEKVNT